MLFGAMLIGAFHAAFENAVIAFKRVGVNIATAIFASAMIDIFMARKVFVQVRVLASFIGHNSRFLRDVSAKDWNQIGGGSAFNMKAANLPAALDKRQDSVFVRKAATLRHIGLVANESLVDFDDCSGSAHWRKPSGAHGFADAMLH